MRVAALVLAAGRSTRMGANKLLELLHDKPLVRHVVDAARASHIDELVVVTGHEGDKLVEALSDCDARFVDNPDYADGLSTSVKAGLSALSPSCDWALILLGDMPLVSSGVINALIARAKASPDHLAAVPVTGGEWGNPVLVSRSAFADLTRLEGDAGARQFLKSRRARVLEVPVDDPAILIDLDTPEALARARMTF